MQASTGDQTSDAEGIDEPLLLPWIRDVAVTYRWAGQRGLDHLAPGTESRALTLAFEAAVADPETTTVVEPAEGGPGALTTVRPKPMETRCFGFPTAAVSEVISPVGLPERHEVIERLLQRVLRDASGRHRLLILRVDVDDVDTLSAAQAVGFRVHECTLTYLVDSQAEAPFDLPPGVTVDVHEGDVRGVLSADDVDRLADASAAWDLNHFRADHRIPVDLVRGYYREWIHNIAAGEWSDCMFVARMDGRVIGVKSETTDAVVSDASGAVTRVGGFMVVTVSGLGTGRALVCVAGRHQPPGGRYRTWDTQARNLSTIRNLELCGVARPIRSAYTLHAWPSGA